MSDMYLPVEEAVDASRDWVMPGRYPVELVASADKVDKSRELGIGFKVTANIIGTEARCYDELFVGSRNSQEKEELNHFAFKNGKRGVHPCFTKYRELVSATRMSVTSVDEALAMFDSTSIKNVSWPIELEASGTSGSIEDWDSFVEWAEETLKQAARINKTEGTFKIVFGRQDELNTPLIEALEKWPGVYMKNTLKCFKPKVSMA